jgi:sortase A
MPKDKSPEDLTVEELRRLLIEKRRADRNRRLDRFRRTGRVVTLAEEFENRSLDDLRSGPEEVADVDVESPSRNRRRRFFDRVLFLVEIAAVAGLVFVLFNGLSLIQELNQEVASALVQPTLTPTPLVVAVVLPSGHTPPDSPGGAKPNDAEIPEHLRPMVQSLASAPLPTPGPEQATRLQIPAIGVDAPIVQGDGWEQLKKGVGQHVGTADPGKRGNVVLSAHNDIFGEIFRHLDQLEPGDEVVVYTNQRAYTYIVNGSDVVEPTAVEVMAATSNPTLTLISCYPYLVDNKRIVVTARLGS